MRPTSGGRMTMTRTPPPPELSYPLGKPVRHPVVSVLAPSRKLRHAPFFDNHCHDNGPDDACRLRDQRHGGITYGRSLRLYTSGGRMAG